MDGKQNDKLPLVVAIQYLLSLTKVQVRDYKYIFKKRIYIIRVLSTNGLTRLNSELVNTRLLSKSSGVIDVKKVLPWDMPLM